MNYQIRVAGVTAENRQKILQALATNPMCQMNLNSSALGFDLVPEPENKYDNKAVAVYLSKKYVVGYVPKGNILQEKVHSGIRFDVSGIIVGGQDGMNYGLILNCKPKNDNEEVEIKEV